MNGSDIRRAEEPPSLSTSDKIKRTIHIMQKFINAGGSRRAIEDYYNDCGTYIGVDIYLEHMMKWLGMSDGDRRNED